MLFYRIKHAVYISLALMVGLVFFFAFRWMSVEKFPTLEGDRVFYLNSASSSGLRKTSLDLKDIFCVRGESVRIQTENVEETVKGIVERYECTILFTETFDGKVSLYGYSPKLGEGIFLKEEYVNLHIVIEKKECKIGSPIIFDGF